MNTRNDIETIIIARGGGSIEDLWAFNEEGVVRAIFKSIIPIISAIGHETDTTIIDYVAALRAATPTATAEKAVPVRSDLIQIILTTEQRLNFLINGYIKSKQDIFLSFIKFLKAPNFIINIFKDKLTKVFNDLNSEVSLKIDKKILLIENLTKVIKPPKLKIELNKSLLNNFNKNMEKIIFEKENFSKKNLLHLSRLLYSNSINYNLKKGYAILTKKNKIIKDTNQVKKQDNIQAKISNGKFNLIIKKIN